MKLSEVSKFIEIAARENFNIMLMGAPGIGKTDILKEVAKNVGMKMHIAHPVTWDVVDARGLPAIVNSCAEFLPFGDLRIMLEAKEDTIFFFDDVGQAANSIQAAIMQLTLERSINGQKVSPHIRFMMASNNRKDGAGVAGLLTPLINRFTIIQIEADAKDWCNWALVNNVPTELIAFLKFKPELISTFDPVKSKDSPFASPRSITMLGKWINAGVINFEVWKGVVGEMFAVEFKGFYDNYSKLAKIPGQVVTNPDNAPVPNQMGLLYALCGALAHVSSDVNLPNIYKYAKRLPKEYTVSLMVDITTRKPDLMKTRSYIQFCSEFENAI